MFDELNLQLNREFYSGYLYLSMCSYFHDKGLPGFANWMRVQAQEELTHAMKFYDYITKTGGKVMLETINKPPLEWGSVIEVFEATLEHEKKVSSHIHQLVDLAIQERDHGTNNFLQWFVSEQLEEEENARNILERLRYAGEDKGFLFLLDQELAKRVFVPATQET